LCKLLTFKIDYNEFKERLGEPMSLMSKEQLKQWIKEKNMQSVEDVQSALKELFADTLQEMLEAQLETSLGYAKHDTNSNVSKVGNVRFPKPRHR
jgi:hypothetical protein